MANTGLSWSVLRPLRPVFLAGAAALTWLALSAPAADANNPHDQSSPLGGIASTVSSAGNGAGNGLGNAAGGAAAALVPDHSADAASEPVNAVPVNAEPVTEPVTPTPETVLAPVVSGITEPVDTFLGELPAPDILPPDPVAIVTDPVVALADTAIADITDTVVQPVTDTLPVDLPVEPISDVLTGTPPLTTPVVTPITDVLDVVDDVVALADQAPLLPAPLDAPVARTGGTGVGTAYSPGVSLLAATAASESPSAHLANSGSSGSGDSPGSSPALPSGGGSPAGGGTQTPEGLFPASPSGSGSGQSSGGPAASAAWLSSPFEYLPLTGIVPVSGHLQHIPSPVAIDPGSSPD